MANNTLGAVDVPCSLFAGLNAELAPSDIPEGVSPDCQDVVFLPGSVATREGLHQVLTNAVAGTSIVYHKTFVQPDGTPLTLVLTSDGKLWREDVFSSPATLTQIGALSPGTFAQSVSASSREYIASSDAEHGVDVPLQYDGTNLDRISQDGPGAPPILANYLTPPATVEGSGTGTPITLTDAVVSDPYTAIAPTGGGGAGAFPGGKGTL